MTRWQIIFLAQLNAFLIMVYFSGAMIQQKSKNGMGQIGV